MNQKKAPLVAAMKAYAAGGAVAFHTPAHKRGRGAHELLKNLITDEGLNEEVSLMYALDDPFHPTGCIMEAEALAADLYGADSAYFMANGTTEAIHVMMLASLNDGDEVILPRNAHRSIFAGLALTGAVPFYIEPVYDERMGVAMGVTPDCVKEAIENHPNAKAVILVYPTYYGVAYDLAGISKIVHEHGMILLVDEAHGAHLRFSDDLPADAILSGADLVAVSTHKLIGSLTQTSMLFRNGNRVPDDRIRRAQGLVASSSPNYLLLASLDIARLQMAADGNRMVGRAVRLSNESREAINDIEGLWCFGEQDIGYDGANSLDACKLTVNVTKTGHTGTGAERILRSEYHFEAELCDAYNVLFIISFADDEEIIKKLIDGLRDFSSRFRKKKAIMETDVRELPRSEICLTPREAYFARSELIDFEKSVGRIAAEEITFYPPGIPVIYPGERITNEIKEYAAMMRRAGLKLTGTINPKLDSIRVVK